jgi:hypothetical protein
MVSTGIVAGMNKVISELEAVKNYPKVLQERDQLSAKMRDYDQMKRQLDVLSSSSKDTDQKAIELVKEIVAEFGKPPLQQKYREELVQAGIPEQIKNLIDKATADRLKTKEDEKLLLVFRQEVQSQIEANKKLFKRERLQRAQALQHKNPFMALAGDWKIKCSQCSQQHTLRLDSDAILLLLRGEEIKVPTPYSVHRFGSSVKLKDIVFLYLFG